MEKDTYKTIKSESEGFYSDKGSKFYAFAYPVSSEEEFKEHLQYLKKKYHDARHHVYAFIIGSDRSFYRASDDGEPSNSSGIPVLGQIRSFELTNVAIIVVRYFGGTKLGVPGLINAYKTSAYDALSNAEIIEKTVNDDIGLIFSYDDMSFVMKVIKDYDAEIIFQEFMEECRIEISIRKSMKDNFISAIEQNHRIVVKKQ
ncbi:MAG: YigZ family protein [Bacteroidales bacterium]|jgi:uncharacterized YigZ family protein|nr:YigZ family protein [Bacteroidales bacterium]